MDHSTPKVKPAAVETSSVNFPTCSACSDTGFIAAQGGVLRCDCCRKKETPSPNPSPTPVAAFSIPSDKAKTQRQRMMAKLEEAGDLGVTNREFIQMGFFRYSSRLRENRQGGHDIETIHVREGLYRYVLHTKPRVTTPLPSFEKKPRADLTPPLFSTVPGGR